MKKSTAIVILLALMGCEVPHDKFFYQIRETGPDFVTVMTTDGVVRQSAEIEASARAHMKEMALTKCKKKGFSKVESRSEGQYKTGGFNSVFELSFYCR